MFLQIVFISQIYQNLQTTISQQEDGYILDLS